MGWFKRTLVVGALATGLLFGGCAQQGTARPSYGSGSLALSTDDKLLYAVDTDNGAVVVVDTQSDAKLATVKVGESPARIVVGADDTLFVTNRGSRSVSVIRRGEWQEAMRLEVGIEPFGLALSPDSKTLYVVSATARDTTEYGLLTAFDTKTLQQVWELNVGEEPRGLAVIDDGKRALVSLYKAGEVVEVDLVEARVKTARSDIYQQANLGRTSQSITVATSTPPTYHPRAAADLVATPDGKRVFAPTVWARETTIAVRPNPSVGYYTNGGPCSSGPVATAGLVTLDTSDGVRPEVDDLTDCAGATARASTGRPYTALTSREFTPPEGLQGPTAGLVSPVGDWLFVVNRESRNLMAMPTERRGEVNIVEDVGHGADGVALTRDGQRAYVYAQFDHRLTRIVSRGGKLQKEGDLVLAQDTLPADLALGRRLFFDAKDTRISSATTRVACSTCHLEGREDGHVWQFPDGPRQTPSLAGRKLLSTAPFHWSGEFATMDAFNAHTIIERMGGSGLDRATAAKLDAYLDATPRPERPMTPDMPAVARGRAAFSKAGCDTCHSGELLTNNENRDVGTLVSDRTRFGGNVDDRTLVGRGFNVPSLLGVSRSAPYLHDGSETTLAARVFGNPGDRHGTTSTLSNAEKADLVAFLKSL